MASFVGKKTNFKLTFKKIRANMKEQIIKQRFRLINKIIWSTFVFSVNAAVVSLKAESQKVLVKSI